MRTIPSAVLGEYLSDVERFWLFTEPSAFKQDIRPILADSLEHGLAGSLDEWFGPEVTKDYWRTLLYRADKESKARARASYQERRAKWVKVEAAKAERPKLKRQRTDARNNDQKIRAVLLANTPAVDRDLAGWAGEQTRAATVDHLVV